jgi:tetratricopeptide (TPR) repeat protein
MRLSFSLLLAVWIALGQAAIRNPQSKPEDINARFNRAAELQRKGMFKEAESEYRALLKIAPKYAEAYANLGAVLIRLDKYQEAIQSYETAYKLAPNLKPILLNIGLAHYRKGEFEKAVDALKRFLAFSPDNAQATQLVAYSLVELGHDEEALIYLEKASTVSPNDPALLYAVGLASLRLKKPMVTGAIQALAEMPGGLAASYLLRGQASLANTQWEKAIVDLEEAAKLSPNLPRLQYSLGLAYLKAGRDDAARNAFEAELRRSPKDVSTLWYLAYIDDQAGKPDEARKWLSQALAIEPSSADANALLGKVLLKQGKPAEALKPLEAAVARDPNDGDKHFQLARAYQQLGRREDATKQFAEYQRLKTEAQEKERLLILKPGPPKD